MPAPTRPFCLAALLGLEEANQPTYPALRARSASEWPNANKMAEGYRGSARAPATVVAWKMPLGRSKENP